MRPKIGIALGSGGARGLAHIGVLRVLQEHQIPIDFIAGSSMGSLIGALFANHNDINMIEKLAIHLKRKYWLDFSVPKLGLITGDKIKELIRILTHGKNIEDLPIPLAIVATDIENGQKKVFREGPIAQAVRASISIPGIFVPERVNDQLLVDGGVVERVPIHSVREMGAEFVIAVDVGMVDAKMKVKSIFDVITQTIDIMERQIYHQQIISADYVIRPNVGEISTTSFTNVKDIIDEGYRKANEVIEEIKEALIQWENHHGKK
ncbi:patatin-like phospholipase family protein [Tepidibacillus infernus]|uniref:patatin-like phospholipase family protein n=1 Tax=Tepidibacillus infernus TaxID=1806172 RepID=UPI003B74261A